MKKTFEKPVGLAALLILLYILGLILSACTISIYPLSRQRDFHTNEAREIIHKYRTLSEDELDLWFDGKLEGKMQISIYDTYGHCLLNVSSDPRLHIHHKEYLFPVLSGKEIYKLQFAQRDTLTIHNLMGITGLPIVEQGSVIGAIFMAKKTIAVTESLIGYVAYFTLLYWLSAFFIVSNIRKKKKLNQLQQTYIANVTHALKTPVASIKALSETLCDEVEPDPDQKKVYYGMILREANRQNHMIRDILELSKLQSSGMDFTKTALRATDIFQPVLEKYATLCDCMDITLHISDSLSFLPPLSTNETCIKQILEILLDNAIKFVPEGGSIWFEVSHTHKQATFCVRDNGIGITKDALPHVFERFYKYSHDFNESGSGLGLAIAREITAGLKERIWVESEVGSGSSFFFTVHLK